ncbi:MAG: N-acetylmuramoyl-L-alanine amidase [Gemmatimonadaceae bacterium]|nr:N-acetylmuramoyl-L-alanine amidase [Gemmatimonadaceae bacterium]
MIDWATRLRNANPSPLAQTRAVRNPQDIAQIQWHATRGKTTMGRQVMATENWFASHLNLLNPDGSYRGWGGSADFVVGPDIIRAGGDVVIVAFGDVIRSWSRWSAGYGGADTLPAAQYGIAIEVAQPAGKRNGVYVDDAGPDVVFEEFTPETIEACAWLVRHVNEALVREGLSEIPSVWVGDWDQLPDQPVPRGHIGHDTMAAGRKYGKSDPGSLFPLSTIFELLRKPPPPTVEQVTARYEAEIAAMLQDVDAALAPYRR